MNINKAWPSVAFGTAISYVKSKIILIQPRCSYLSSLFPKVSMEHNHTYKAIQVGVTGLVFRVPPQVLLYERNKFMYIARDAISFAEKKTPSEV